MELIGRIERRRIYYLQIRNNWEWKKYLPKKDWAAFTIANKEDEELVPSMVKTCFDKNVSYTCSAGEYAQMTEAFFDEEIAWRGVDFELKTKKETDFESSLISTTHENIEEGFWFATTVAKEVKFEIEIVVCLDLTKKKIKNHLIDLIQKINNGWLPSNKEIEGA